MHIVPQTSVEWVIQTRNKDDKKWGYAASYPDRSTASEACKRMRNGLSESSVRLVRRQFTEEVVE